MMMMVITGHERERGRGGRGRGGQGRATRTEVHQARDQREEAGRENCSVPVPACAVTAMSPNSKTRPLPSERADALKF
jgi:hypothetical protein